MLMIVCEGAIDIVLQVALRYAHRTWRKSDSWPSHNSEERVGLSV